MGEDEKGRSEELLRQHLARIPANPCRCAISFSFSNNAETSFEPPYLSEKHLPFPALALRVAVCSAQILNYSTLAFGDPRGWMTLAGRALKRKHLNKLYNVFKRSEGEFAGHYREEIAGKFVAVCLKAPSGGACAAPRPSPKVGKGTPAAGPAVRWGRGGEEDAREKGAAAWARAAAAVDGQAADGKRRQRSGGAVAVSAGSAEEDAEEEEMEGAACGVGGLGGCSDSELEDDALEAMLQAEESNNSVMFHDDFDVLEASGACVCVCV